MPANLTRKTGTRRGFMSQRWTWHPPVRLVVDSLGSGSNVADRIIECGEEASATFVRQHQQQVICQRYDFRVHPRILPRLNLTESANMAAIAST